MSSSLVFAWPARRMAECLNPVEIVPPQLQISVEAAAGRRLSWRDRPRPPGRLRAPRRSAGPLDIAGANDELTAGRQVDKVDVDPRVGNAPHDGAAFTGTILHLHNQHLALFPDDLPGGLKRAASRRC